MQIGLVPHWEQFSRSGISNTEALGSIVKGPLDPHWLEVSHLTGSKIVTLLRNTAPPSPVSLVLATTVAYEKPPRSLPWERQRILRFSSPSSNTNSLNKRGSSSRVITEQEDWADTWSGAWDRRSPPRRKRANREGMRSVWSWTQWDCLRQKSTRGRTNHVPAHNN